MTNISKYHSVKVISAVMGFIVLSELAVAQDMIYTDDHQTAESEYRFVYQLYG